MKLNGKEVRFNITDPRDAKRYEETLIKLKKKEKELKKSGQEYTLDEIMREIIKICREVLWDFTGQDVLKGCHDALMAKEVLYQFLREVARQNESLLSPFDLERIR